MSQDSFRENVVAANQRVHSAIADKYNEVEPHFRLENRLKVRARLERLAAMAPGTRRLLDMGCGTGFVIGLLKDLFEEIHGIDATRSMLERVDLSSGNITLHEGVVEELPFPDAHFDVVTAYSFLDHLADHRLVLKEASRVLRPGGVLYIDLVPNRSFWSLIYKASESRADSYGPIVDREIDELVYHEEKLERLYGISPDDWRNAEPSKSHVKGFDPDELRQDLVEYGFESQIDHEWFLGEASVFHGDSEKSAQLISNHLQSVLPISRGLFKYLVIVGVKK
jgi:ubiquinone/menaquinone biosynthesis C-methylase UbiE